MRWGRKDAFPGADGSTITPANGNNANAETKTIYGPDGNDVLDEDVDGYKRIEVQQITQEQSNTINYAIKNPLTYIYSQTKPNDWYASDNMYQNDGLWNDGKSYKSTYDPCPTHWRVPSDGTWEDFNAITMPMFGSETNVSNGRLYNQQGWYPLMGRRYSLSGMLCLAGNCCYYWSSSVAADEGTALSFHVYPGNTMGPSYASHRCIGYAVRCVQE